MNRHAIVRASAVIWAVAMLVVGCGPSRPGSTSLHDAARMNDPAAVKAALAQTPSGVDVRDSHMQTPLIAAARVHALDSMQSLLDAGADINARDLDGYTALHWAAYTENPSTAKFLLDHKADPNLRDTIQETALLLAAKNGYGDVVTVIAGYPGVDLNGMDRNKWTALEYGVKQGRPEIVTALMEKGADPNTHDGDGWTPLLYAADAGYIDIAKTLVEKGANPNLRAPNGESPLARAQKKGYLDLAKYLDSKGAQ